MTTRLNGWKEVAGYLGRGVRTAQRWERDFGLPIRRLGEGGSASVFAFTAELDAWRQSPAAARALGFETEAADSPSPPGSRRRLCYWLVAAGVVCALTAAGVWRLLSWRQPAGSAQTPVAWRVDGHSFVALDADGRVRWTYTLPAEASPGGRANPIPGAIGGTADLDHDGRREFWFIPFRRDEDAALAKIYLFNQNGTLRWTYRHTGTIGFGTKTFEGPWIASGAFVTEHPDDPARSAFWVASRAARDFPALLVPLDVHTGQPLGAPFWNAGRVLAASLMRTSAGPRLVVGLTHDERNAPAAAVLDARAIGGSSPAESAAYRCTSCAAGGPLSYVLLPKPQRLGDAAGDGVVSEVGIGGAFAPITVRVNYGDTGSGNAASVIFRLDGDLKLIRAEPRPLIPDP